MSPTSIAARMVVMATAACVSCGNDGVSGQATVELGTGTVDFVALAEDQNLDLISGIQGGFHFIVNARARGIDPGDANMPGLPGNPRTLFTAYDDTGVQVDLGAPPFELGYRADGDAFSLPSGRQLRIKNEEVSRLYGQRVELRVRLEDRRGREADASIFVTAIKFDDLDLDAGVSGFAGH